MNRSSFLAAAMAASALFVMSGSAASANAPAPLPFEGVAVAQSQTADSQTAPPATTPASDVQTGGTTLPAVPVPPATPPVASATANLTPSTPAPAAPSGGEVAAPATPGALTPAATTPTELVAESVRATGTQADTAAGGRPTDSLLPSDAGAASGAPHPAAPASPSGQILERTLPGLERRLRGVQNQMNDLERRLAAGGSAPAKSLVRLSRSLELIAPALVALGTQVDAGGRLSPHLRHLLHRVNKRLGGANASAAALAVALRRSGMRGPEVALLLHELQDFQALTPGFAAFPAGPLLTQTQPVNAAYVAFTHDQTAPAPAPAPAPPPHRAAAPQRPAAANEATAWQRPAAPDDLLRQASASGSASAGPGGGFSAAGLAALAALLGVLALPRLLSRVQLPPMRCYAAVFLVPLQRPG